MEKTDYLKLDGTQMRLLLTIQKAGSLSAAARVLDMNQSTVSYWLDQMRERLDDPLFVRAGNGVEPTERAKALFPIAREVLSRMQSMCETDAYDPIRDTGVLRIVATAVERDCIVARLMRAARHSAPGLRIEIGPSGSPSQVIEKLQQDTTDIVLMAAPITDSDGIMRRTLFNFDDAVFFDQDYPLDEGDLDAFCARPQARVALGPDAGFSIDKRLAKSGHTRRIALQAGDFDSVLSLIRGTDLIATMPKILATKSGAGIGHVAPPWAQDLQTMMCYWHARNQTSARHKFWRDQVAACADIYRRNPLQS